ncbi:MAG: hypothetical protein O3B74_12025, partial [Proteobacteria bacterium]|nr:hypothetical protein [Pseudomonadota bacterium]
PAQWSRLRQDNRTPRPRRHLKRPPARFPWSRQSYPNLRPAQRRLLSEALQSLPPTARRFRPTRIP